MTDAVEPLLRDLIAWIGSNGRPYEEVMEAWRTSCPRLPVWEEATDRGFVERARVAGASVVLTTPAGREFCRRMLD